MKNKLHYNKENDSLVLNDKEFKYDDILTDISLDLFIAQNIEGDYDGI